MQLKESILHELLQADGGYCSGASLAKAFGCSRTAVWKAIEQLKADGCQINAVTNRGYKLIEAPDILLPAYLKGLLEGCATDWQPQYLPEVDSTNTRLKALAAEGAIIPPNREFAAVLGDQSSGMNIETPERLLREIVREESGNSAMMMILGDILEAIRAGKEITVDGYRLGKTMQRYQTMAARSNG